MGIVNKILKVFGFESDEKLKPEKNKTKASFKIKNGKIKSRPEEIDGVPVYYPENFLQVNDYADFLKRNQPCIISIEYCDKVLSEKILIFLEGVCYVLNAKKIEIETNKLFLFLPEGMEIE